jgi:PucR C-terminal helix-turn-helix domain/GGDEF-like domain
MKDTALRQVLQRLSAAGVIPRTASLLAASVTSAGAELRKAVLADVPAFASSGNPEIMPGLDQHAKDHLGEILRLFSGGLPGDFAFVAAHAQRRAEQRFPLEATLHAYRSAHRVLSHWLREAAVAAGPANPELAVSAAADFSIEYTNLISSISTAEYVAHTRMLAEAEGDRRTELLNILLSGYDESDGRVAQLLKRAGYLEQRQTYCIAVAQAANASEMENPARAQRIANAITDAMAGTSIRALTGIRSNLAVAVLSDRRRQSGWTAPQSGLSERIRPLLLTLGPSVLVGASADHPSTSFLPKALNEASIALDFASVTQRVVQFSDLPIRALLVHRGGDYVRSAPPRWAHALVDADAKASGALIQTLRAVADADMNVQKAARGLGKHANTVYARIERIKDLTGLDGQHYRDLTEMLLAADCWRV